MRISDWSSDVCSSDLPTTGPTRHITKGAREPPVRGSEAVPASERRRRADADAVERGAKLFLETTELGLGLRLATNGRASRRARVRQYLVHSVVAVAFKTTNNNNNTNQQRKCNI